MKKYISRNDAVKKYRIGYQTILTWEKKGRLKAYNAAKVRYSQVKKKSGPTVRIVYDESQLEILAQNVIRDAKLVQHSRMEAEAFELLENGADVIDLVKQLKINRRTAAQIRDFYLIEKGAVLVLLKDLLAIRELGFPFTQQTAAADIARLVEWVLDAKAKRRRSDKPPPPHVRFIPDDET